MPTLLKRSNGIYYYVQKDDAGHRRWISTGQQTHQEALKAIRERDGVEWEEAVKLPYDHFDIC